MIQPHCTVQRGCHGLQSVGCTTSGHFWTCYCEQMLHIGRPLYQIQSYSATKNQLLLGRQTCLHAIHVTWQRLTRFVAPSPLQAATTLPTATKSLMVLPARGAKPVQVPFPPAGVKPTVEPTPSLAAAPFSAQGTWARSLQATQLQPTTLPAPLASLQ